MKIRVVRKLSDNSPIEILWFWQIWIENVSDWILEIRNYMPEWIYMRLTDIGWTLGWLVDDSKIMFPASHRVIRLKSDSKDITIV